MHVSKKVVFSSDFSAIFAILFQSAPPPPKKKFRTSAIEFYLVELVIFSDIIMKADKGRN